MKKIILSLLLAATASAFAQSSFKGTLVSTDQKPISAANIILITLPDSTLVKGAISDAKGVFELPNTAENKKIIIKITHLEYAHQHQCSTIVLTKDAPCRDAYQLPTWGKHLVYRRRL